MTWQTKKLSEICDFKRGLTYSKKDEVDFSKNIVLRSNNINLTSSSLNLDELRYIDNKITIPNSKKIKKGSIIICTANGSKSHLGKIALIDKDYGYSFGGFMGQLIPNNEINSKYFFYVLTSDFYKKHLAKISSGANINNLKFSDLSELQIPLPPLPEQKRIVKILDEVFENVEKAKGNAEKNLNNSKELFESYLQNVFANPGENWEEKSLGEVCSLITKGSSPKWQGINYVEEPGILFITSENVGDGQLILDKRKYVEEKFNKKDKKSILQKGDVLTNIVGASIGRTAIFDLDDVSNINQAVCILRCKPEVIFNKYLMNLLNSPFLKIILHSNEVNTARANLSLGFFSNLSIPFPPISEQKVIVKKLDALSEQTKKLEGVYKKKLVDLEELKKSILNKAFKGEL